MGEAAILQHVIEGLISAKRIARWWMNCCGLASPVSRSCWPMPAKRWQSAINVKSYSVQTHERHNREWQMKKFRQR